MSIGLDEMRHGQQIQCALLSPAVQGTEPDYKAAQLNAELSSRECQPLAPS